MTDDQISRILTTARTIASVGLSSDPRKESQTIAAYLMRQRFRVIPVNPGAREILGETTYPDLLAIPEPVDVVQIFRPSADVPPIVEQAIQIRARVVWMQQGIAHPEAARRAEAAGLLVVQDRCMRIEHLRLIAARRAASTR